jgi:glutaredoxin
MSLKIYSTNDCPRCKILKAAFQEAQIAYEEKTLDATVMARVLCETNIWVQAAPLVLVGSTWYFHDDFFDSSGNLLPKWLENMKGIKPHKAAFTGHATNDTKRQECSKIWKDDKCSE